MYSLKPEPPVGGFEADGHWMALTPEGTVLDAKPVVPPVTSPLGFVAGGTAEQPLLFLANAEHIAVMTLAALWLAISGAWMWWRASRIRRA